MEAVAIAAAVVGAYGSIEQGKSQRQMYRLQAQQASVEAQRKSIQYEQRSNDILRRLQSTNSALAARAYAGGVNPFSGSPDIVRAANDTAAGREYTTLLFDADAAMRAGETQAGIYRAAGDTAYRAGMFSAVAKLGMAAATYGSMSGTQAPAPVETRTLPTYQP